MHFFENCYKSPRHNIIMFILVTGGFGQVGLSIVNELLQRGHRVRVMELATKKTQKVAKEYADKVEVLWGNVLDPASLQKAVVDVDAVVHLAGILPPLSETNKELCFKVNVGGTHNLIEAIKTRADPAPILFASSASVMGPTQSRTPPISAYDPPNPTTNYTHSKVQVEQDLKSSGLAYCICRFGAVIPTLSTADRSLMKNAFDIPLNDRVEMVLDLDLAVAVANAVELMVKGDSLNKKILNIGGGKANGMQRYGRDLTQAMFEAMGIGELDEKCFTTKEYFIDWMDTEESQRLLQYQNHTYEQLVELSLKPYKKIRPFMRLFSPFIRRYFEGQSPYRKQVRKSANLPFHHLESL